MTTELFKNRCVELLASPFEAYGFVFQQVIKRVRGTVVEFRREKDKLFLACDGDVLVADMILYREANLWWRVSLNQMLWFNGNRSLSKVSTWDQQLSEFAKAFPSVSPLFAEPLKFDRRYCFVMDEGAYKSYVKFQSGKAERK